MKYNNASFMFFIQIIVIGMLTVNSCSSMQELSSRWVPKKIVIDGDNSEWKDVPSSYIAKNKFMFSICNDDDYLYVCLATREKRTQMQIMSQGFTVWLDPDGGSDETFGINFPLGRQPSERPQNMDRSKMEELDRYEEMFKTSQTEIEIVGIEEADRYRIPAMNSSGIQAKIGRTEEGIMVYELKVPLRKSSDNQYAINVTAGGHVGVGFKTAEIKFGMEGPPSGGGPPGEGPGGGMGGPPGGGMGGPPGGGMGGPPSGGRGHGDQSGLIDLWVDVILAKQG